MMHADVIVSPRSLFGCGTEVKKRETMMLIVVGKKREALVAMLNACVEDLDIPIDEFVEAMGLVDDVRKLAGCDQSR
jgi:hypothetical protein